MAPQPTIGNTQPSKSSVTNREQTPQLEGGAQVPASEFEKSRKALAGSLQSIDSTRFEIPKSIDKASPPGEKDSLIKIAEMNVSGSERKVSDEHLNELGNIISKFVNCFNPVISPAKKGELDATEALKRRDEIAANLEQFSEHISKLLQI